MGRMLTQPTMGSQRGVAGVGGIAGAVRYMDRAARVVAVGEPVLAGSLAEEIDATLTDTCHPDPRVRAEALRALCPCHLRSNHRQVWDRVLEMAGDPDARVRGHILHLLADGSPREREGQVVAALERMQVDADLGLRRRARKVMAQYRRTGRVNVL